MGHSVTCNFWVNVNKTSGLQSCHGAMTFKQVKNIMASEQLYEVEKALRNGVEPVMIENAEMWPQTARGRNQIKLDYAIMNRKGEIEHKAIS